MSDFVFLGHLSISGLIRVPEIPTIEVKKKD